MISTAARCSEVWCWGQLEITAIPTIHTHDELRSLGLNKI